MENERDSLVGCQCVEDDEKGAADGVDEDRLPLRVAVPTRVRHRVRNRMDVALLAARLARAQHVETDARHHGRQPGREVLHFVDVGASQPEPGVLNGVVGLAR